MKFLKKSIDILKKSLSDFIGDNCFQFSAAVSFYTLFSMAPIALMVVYVGGIFVKNSDLVQRLQSALSEVIGSQGASAVVLLLENINPSSQSYLFILIGIGVLLYSATNLFIQFKISFNLIYRVRTRDGKALIKELKDRAIAFGIIIFLGVALILSLVIEAILFFVINLLSENVGADKILNFKILKNLTTTVVLFFGVYFFYKILPDVDLKKIPLAVGSLISLLLLLAGKSVIGQIIGSSSLTEISGASTSVIVLMLWVYYSSIIIFFGMEIIKNISESYGYKLTPNKFSVKVKLVEMLDKE